MVSTVSSAEFPFGAVVEILYGASLKLRFLKANLPHCGFGSAAAAIIT